MNHEKQIRRQRLRRRRHVRRRVRGTAMRPRLTVFRSHKHIYCQVIDDEAGKTIASAGTRDESPAAVYGGNVEAAERIGKTIAERAAAAGVKKVAFDRGHYQYHGRVAALAEAARKAGLSF